MNEKQSINSYSIQTLDEKVDKIIFPISIKAGRIVHQFTGKEYLLEETPRRTGLQLK